MALVFVEGGDHHGTTASNMINAQTKKWGATQTPGLSTASNVVGRFDLGRAFQMNTGNDTYVTPRFGNYQQLTIGFSMKRTGRTGNVWFCCAQDATTEQVCLSVDDSGVLWVSREQSTAAANILARGTTNLRTNNWFQIEFRVLIHPSAGEVEVRINEFVEFNVTGLNTRSALSTNNYVNEFRFNGSGGNSGIALDDIWVNDTSGSFNTGFLGDVGVETIYPNGAGTTTQFGVVGAASNYLATTDNPADNDTSYVATTTVGDTDLYTYQDLTRISTNIRGVQYCTLQRKTNIGGRTIAEVTRSGGTNYVGATNFVTDDYQYALDIREQDPNTAAQWTDTAVNAAEFGFRLIS